MFTNSEKKLFQGTADFLSCGKSQEGKKDMKLGCIERHEMSTFKTAVAISKAGFSILQYICGSSCHYIMRFNDTHVRLGSILGLTPLETVLLRFAALPLSSRLSTKPDDAFSPPAALRKEHSARIGNPYPR